MDFKKSPYFDDYSEHSGYVRVLFRPDRNIQARELNTIQSIFTAQLKRFADHVFKNGTKVSDARTRMIEYSFIVTSAPTDFVNEGFTLAGDKSGQQATFVTRTGNRVCIEFKGSNLTGSESRFHQNERVSVYNKSQQYMGAFSIDNVKAYSGKQFVFVIERGVFYWNGYFVENKRFALPVDLAPTSNFDIGFNVVERVVTHYDDSNLLDNNPSPQSYQNPGADRLQISFDLAVRSADDVTEKFICLARVRRGNIEYILSSTEYNLLGDYIAQRTYDESGSYTVRDFKMTLLEHKSDGPDDTFGLDEDGLEENYAVRLEPSVAYVRGYRVEAPGRIHIVSEKARDVKAHRGFVKTFNNRTYIKAIPSSVGSVYPNMTTSVDVNDNSMITLYDGPLNIDNVPTGNAIGTLRVCDVMQDGQDGDGNSIYRYLTHSIQMQSGKRMSEVMSLYHAGASFAAHPYVDTLTGVFTVYNPGSSELVWEIDTPFVKSLRDADDSSVGSITITKRTKFNVTVESNGTAVIRAPSGEYFKNPNSGTIVVVTVAGVTTTPQYTISATTNTLTISVGSHLAGGTLCVITDVVSTNLAEKTKISTEFFQTFSDITLGILTLSKTDVLRCKVFVVPNASSDDKSSWVDVTPRYNLFNGQTDVAYVNAAVVRNAGESLSEYAPESHTIRVEGVYLDHNGTEGYFTVDSYVDIGYDEIQTYVAANGRRYKLASCFDFRPMRVSGANSVSHYPTIGDTAVFDMSVYLSRVDTVAVNANGHFLIFKGIPAENPMPITLEEDHMALYHLTLAPYTSSLTDIAVKRIDNRRYTMRDIGRLEERLKNVEYYTSLNILEKSAADMTIKDIDGFDRFKNGFMADNFSNFQAADLGSSEFRAAIDRTRGELRPSFKSRNFRLNYVGDLRVGGTIVGKRSTVVPGTDIRQTGGLLMFRHTWEPALAQRFATKSVSVNPYFMFSKRGKLALSPNVDTWADTTTRPEVQINIDTGTTELLNQIGHANGFGKTLGEWSEINRTVIDTQTSSETSTSFKDMSSTVSKLGTPVVIGGQTVSTPPRPIAMDVVGARHVMADRSGFGALTRLGAQSTTTSSNAGTTIKLANGGSVVTTTGGITTTTTTTTVIDTMEVTERKFKDGVEVAGRTDKHTTGDRVSEVKLMPYVRSIDVEFVGTSMRPSTIVYAFFDGKPVSAHCRPAGGVFGDQLKTNEFGEISGVFRIPEKTFFVGQREFKLTGDPSGGVTNE